MLVRNMNVDQHAVVVTLSLINMYSSHNTQVINLLQDNHASSWSGICQVCVCVLLRGTCRVISGVRYQLSCHIIFVGYFVS